MSKWRIKTAILFNFFLFGILTNSVSTVTLQVQNYYGVTKVSAAMLGVIEGWTIAAVSFIIASYIIKIGYRRAMLFALALLTITCFLIPFIKSYTSIRFLYAIVGIGFAFIKISILGVTGLISDNDKEQISLMSFLESFFMIGVLAGYFIFSLFIDDHNIKSPAWFHVFYLLGFLYLLAFIWQLFSPLDESAAKPTASDNNKGQLTDTLKLLLLPAVVSFIIAAFLSVLLEQSIMEWLPTFTHEVFRIPSSFSIMLSSIMPASIAAGRLCGGFVLKRFHWLNVLVTCMLLTAVLIIVALPLAKIESIGLVEHWKDVPIIAYIIPMVGFFLAPTYPVINSVILAALPKSEHGKISGLIMVFSAIGGSIGAVAAGFIFQHYGGLVAFYFPLIPVGLLTTALIVFKKKAATGILKPLNTIA